MTTKVRIENVDGDRNIGVAVIAPVENPKSDEDDYMPIDAPTVLTGAGESVVKLLHSGHMIQIYEDFAEIKDKDKS